MKAYGMQRILKQLLPLDGITIKHKEDLKDFPNAVFEYYTVPQLSFTEPVASDLGRYYHFPPNCLRWKSNTIKKKKEVQKNHDVK